MLSQAAEKQTANWPASVSVLGGTGVGELELGKNICCYGQKYLSHLLEEVAR